MADPYQALRLAHGLSQAGMDAPRQGDLAGMLGRMPPEQLAMWREMMRQQKMQAPAAPQQPTLRPFAPGERRETADGINTELSVTVRLPSGEFANIPSLWMGPQGPVDLDEERALAAAQEYEGATGRLAPRFKTVEEAVDAARKRSAGGGASKVPLFQPPVPEPQPQRGISMGSAPQLAPYAGMLGQNPGLAQMLMRFGQ